MEQYWLQTPQDIEDLLFILPYFAPEKLYVRKLSCMGGQQVISDILTFSTLEIEKTDKGILLHNYKFGQEISTYEYMYDKDCPKNLALAYERAVNKQGNSYIPGYGFAPFEKGRRPVRTTMFRGVDYVQNNLLEVSFLGMIPLTQITAKEEYDVGAWRVDREKIEQYFTPKYASR